MKCPDPGFIQSFLDGEISREDRKNFSLHLDQCSSCREMVKQLKDLEEWTGKALQEGYPSISNEKLHINVDRAWFDFQNRFQATETGLQKPIKKGGITLNNKAKKWIAGSAAAIVVASSFTIPQVRAAASDFLSNFRMQQVEFVKLTQEDMENLSNMISGRHKGEYEIKGIGTLEIVDGNLESKQFQKAADAQKAGITVPITPQDMVLQNISVEPGITLRLTLDTERANKMLKQMKSKSLFDEKLNGKEITLTVPESTLYYFSTINVNGGGNKQSDYFLTYRIIPNPVVNVPENVDVNELRKTILGLPFIPNNLKTQLAGIDNWQQTLPIPLPGDQITEQNFTINGVSGKYAENKQGPGQVIIWQKDGKLNVLNNEGNNKVTSAKLAEIAARLS